uniref:Secreted protein n=1 Tax=Arundo donax TaxID=35708 RepID=A0A0A9DMF6_ARUDO
MRKMKMLLMILLRGYCSQSYFCRTISPAEVIEIKLTPTVRVTQNFGARALTEGLKFFLTSLPPKQVR